MAAGVAAAQAWDSSNPGRPAAAAAEAVSAGFQAKDQAVAWLAGAQAARVQEQVNGLLQVQELQVPGPC